MFRREQRYVVLKITDIYQALTSDEIDLLIKLSSLITNRRKRAGKLPLQTVVVEQDWPEYEPVWKMLEERVNGV